MNTHKVLEHGIIYQSPDSSSQVLGEFDAGTVLVLGANHTVNGSTWVEITTSESILGYIKADIKIIRSKEQTLAHDTISYAKADETSEKEVLSVGSLVRMGQIVGDWIEIIRDDFSISYVKGTTQIRVPDNMQLSKKLSYGLVKILAWISIAVVALGVSLFLMDYFYHSWHMMTDSGNITEFELKMQGMGNFGLGIGSFGLVGLLVAGAINKARKGS